MPLDIDNFEVLDPLGVSTEGTPLGSDKSKVDIIFNAVPARWSALSIKFRDDPFPFTFYEQFQYVRYATGGQTNPTIYHSVAEATTKEGSAYNYYKALIGGGHVNDQGDLAKEGIANLFVVSYVSGSNKVTVTAVDNCMKFETFMANADITVNIFNQDCTPSLLPLTATDFSSSTLTPCLDLDIHLTTSELLVEILQPVVVNPNTDNPFVFSILRGQTTIFQGKDINGRILTKTYIAPPVLDLNKFLITITNKSNIATIDISNTLVQSTLFPIQLQYKVNTGEWTLQSSFNVLLAASYTLYIKDNFGCEISIPFTVTGYQDTNPTVVKKIFCGDLHELNVGKFLNLFGKQHTMKLGFVCNASAKDVKIFKHIQMLLNIEYAVKNINIKTSRGQERFVPGEHLNYRIREGQHSVPLKNPRDYDDLRGNWSYLEVEIESINNSKVDLFSIMMYLRKSTI